MQIKRIRIQNYRCYQDANLELDRSLILVTGSNDGGKSALLQAIELLLYPRAKPDEADFRALDPSGEEKVDEIYITAICELDGEARKIRRRFWTKEGDIQWQYEIEMEVPKDEEIRSALDEFKDWLADEQREFLGKLGFDEFGSNQSKRYEQLEEHAADAPSEPAWIEHSPDFPDVNRYISEEMGDPVKDVEKFLKSAVEDRVREVKTSDKRYAEIERELEDTGNDELDVLEDIFSRYDYNEEDTRLHANLDFDLLKGLSLNELDVSQNGNVRPINKLGAARRRKLLLALQEWRLESLRDSETETSLFLLYDEPDTHFDYEAQRKLFSILRQLAEECGVQVLVATHSLNLIDSVEISDIAYLVQDTDSRDVIRTRVQRLKEWAEIHDIARELGLRNHIVLNACLLCTEGKTEERLIPELYRLYSGRSLPSIGVEMIRGTNRGKDPAWRLCKHILRNNREAFLMLDADAKDPQSGKKIDPAAIQQFNNEEGCRLADPSENVVFLGNKEIEDLFADHTLAAAYQRYLAEHGHQIPAGDDAEQVVSNARDHADGLCGGLEKFTFQNTDGEFSKTDFCEHLIAVLRTDPDTHPIPDEIEDAFDMLEAYVDAS